ncbi:MAG: VWA domain-containing protein [Nitrospirae bacterium]|nr:VWA domain-containing protein [Nitrospirota bacterium]
MTVWFNRRILGYGIYIVMLSVICSYDQACGDANHGLDVVRGLNVVIAVEGSGRMREVDPRMLFAPAAKMFITLLGKNDRVGVIRFADKTESLSDLTAVGNNSDRETLFKTIDKISWPESSKQPGKQPSKQLGKEQGKEQADKANVTEAIDSAIKMLTKGDNKGAKSPLTAAGTVGTIILLYDAKSDIEEALGKDRVIEKTLKDNGIKVFAIAIGDKAEKEPAKSSGAFYKATGGFFYPVRQASGIYMRFASIFENLTSPMMIPIEKPKIKIDESIRAIAFVIKKNSPTKQLSLDDPEGMKYLPDKKIEGVDWLLSDTLDVIKIKDPMPGTWSLNLGYGRENMAYIWTGLRLEVNMEDLYQDTGKPLLLEAWFKLDDLALNLEQMLSDITVKAEVLGPDGIKTSLSLDSRMAVKGSRVLYVNQFIPMKDGNYKIEITAAGNGFERRRVLTIAAEKHEQPKAEPPTEKMQKYDRTLDKFVFMRTTKKRDMTFTRAVAYFIIINIVSLAGIVGYAKRMKLKRQVGT